MYTPVESRFGVQPIAFSSAPNTILQSGQSPFANQEHPLGTIIRAYDGVYGEGEFIYLLGVVSTVVGSLVVWAGSTGTIPAGVPTFQTALCPATANLGQPVAVAMSANVAGQWGWYQITGNAVVAENGTFTAGAAVFLTSATAGVVTTSVAAGKQIMNARSVIADGQPAAGFGVMYIDRPFVEGQIT
jgi:hypothetical protein